MKAMAAAGSVRSRIAVEAGFAKGTEVRLNSMANLRFEKQQQ